MAASIDPSKKVRGLHRGPLVPHVGAYIKCARDEGYPPKSVLVQVQLVASFNQYLWRRHRGVVAWCTSDIATATRYLTIQPKLAAWLRAYPLSKPTVVPDNFMTRRQKFASVSVFRTTCCGTRAFQCSPRNFH